MLILFILLFSPLQVIALTIVSLGVAVATVTDLQFNLFGALVALAWIIPSATNKILWSSMQQQENWTALAYVICLPNHLSFMLCETEILHKTKKNHFVLSLVVGFNRLMWKTTPITLLFLVVMIPWLDPPGILSFDWNFHSAMAIFLSAILGFLLQWSGALALG